MLTRPVGFPPAKVHNSVPAVPARNEKRKLAHPTHRQLVSYGPHRNSPSESQSQ